MLAFEQHLAKFLAAILEVAFLHTVSFAVQHQFAVPVHTVAVFIQHAVSPTVRQCGIVAKLPLERYLGVNFIDVLTTRTATAGVLHIELVGWDGKSTTDREIVQNVAP